MEITIKTKDEATMRKLLQFIQQIGLEIAASTPNSLTVQTKKEGQIQPTRKSPKIEWAKEPEKAGTLFGAWKDTPMNLSQIRNTAWGNRL